MVPPDELGDQARDVHDVQDLRLALPVEVGLGLVLRDGVGDDDALQEVAVHAVDDVGGARGEDAVSAQEVDVARALALQDLRG